MCNDCLRVSGPVTETSVSEASEGHLALQRVVPRSLRITSQRHILSPNDLEASFLITRQTVSLESIIRQIYYRH